MIVICPECGAENSLTAETCQECGFSLLGVIPTPLTPSQASEEDDLDLLSDEDHDLPDLLNALKQDDAIKSGDDDQATSPSLPQEQSGKLLDLNEDEDEDNIPEWLKRIRKRAQEEKDSVGEITRKIKAARESLEDEKTAEGREQYESYIQDLRGKMGIRDAAEPAEKESQDANRESGDDDSEWLSKFKKAHGIGSDTERDSDASIEERQGDSLLQWLVALEDRGEAPKPLSEAEEDLGQSHRQDTVPARISSEKPDPDSTQQIRTGELKFEPPELSVSREEQTQADQLAAAIVNERASRPVRQPMDSSFTWLHRLILGIILITGLSFSLFAGGHSQPSQTLLRPQNEALIRWVNEIPADASLLIIFDYAAGYASELSLVSEPILNAVLKEDSSIAIASSTPSGALLAGRLMDKLDVGEGYEVADLGYYPVAAYGAYGMAGRQDSDWIALNLPEPDKSLPSGDFDGVLILSDSFEGAQMWIEQLSALMPETPLNLLVTAQAGPMLHPYWESGQVSGMISGISEAAGLEAVWFEDDVVSLHWQAYQTGILILITLLVMGVIFNIDRRAADHPRGEA
jgi:hypothetical protein